MNAFKILDEIQEPKEAPLLVSISTLLLEQTPAEDPTKPQKVKMKSKTNCNTSGKKKSSEANGDTEKPKKTKKKSTKTSKGDKKKAKINLSERSGDNKTSELKTLPTTDEEATFVGSSVDEFFELPSNDDCEMDAARQPRMPRRVSFGASDAFAYRRDSTNGLDTSLTIEFGDENVEEARSNRSLHADKIEASPVRRLSYLASSIKSLLSVTCKLPEHCDIDNRDRSTGRRSTFASSRGKKQNQNFRISKNLTKMKAERIEAFFYNHGMEIALGVLYLAINILVGAHGAYQFTERGGWTTEDDILRVTLPIARAGGRLVTLNCALLLLTSCKYLWTCVRTYVAPVLPIGFPIDNIMPKYHRYVALTVIFSGCIIHTLPQIVNYATRSISMNKNGMRIWTFGDGFATKQLLLTGTLLTIIFSTFFVTTLKCFRKTATGFRWFWFFHVGGIATAYPLLLIHGTYRGHPVFLYFALIPLILYLFDIAMRRSNILNTNVLKWKTHEDEGQQITELTVRCPKNFVYTPGQYVELKFPPISNTEWHPFTIASAPNEEEDEKKLIFYIKNAGRWTESLYSYASSFDLAKAKVSTQIQIRGPHGASAMNYFEYKHIVVIGSGVGVTPLLAIWKYLVAKGRKMMYNPNTATEDPVCSHSVQSNDFHDENMDESFSSTMDFGGEIESSSSNTRSTCIFLEKIFESVTVSMSLLVLFVLGETLTFVLQMFGYRGAANVLGFSLSLIAFAIHGSTVVVSAVALGGSNYLKMFKCWLECTIIIADAIATIALWLSIKRYNEKIVGVVNEQNMGANTIYFLFFGFVITLHAIRIFHIFYTTLKPASSDVDNDVDSIDNSFSSFRSLTFSYRSRGSATSRQEVCSIDGILINRMYSNMKFAARSLLRPIIEDDLSDLFSMEFYGTREKSKDQDHSERGLIADLMGSEGHGLDIRTCVCKRRHDDYFHTGRPDWNKIFLKAIAKAHQRNPEGESVGVFFCGSPAIAKDLQVAAAEVTARHQFAMKHLDGKACKCKLIIHSENF